MRKTSAEITRRSMIAGTAAGTGMMAAAASSAEAVPKKAVRNGRLKQSVCKWCYGDMPLDELARNAAEIGLKSVELLTEEEWPVVTKHGLICAVGSGVNDIPDGLNDTANHAAMEKNFRRLIPLAKKHGVPNLICFSGNRRNISDERAWENSALLLNKVKAGRGRWRDDCRRVAQQQGRSSRLPLR